MARFQAGETQAFDVLVRRYERELYGYLRRYLGDGSLAEDVFQNTFLQLYLKSSQYETGRPVRPWLYTIATHQAIDALRRNGRHQAVSLDQPARAAPTARSDSLAASLEGRGPGPFDAASGQEQAERIRASRRPPARFPPPGADPGLLPGAEIPRGRRDPRHPGRNGQVAAARRPGQAPGVAGRPRPPFMKPETMDETLIGYLLDALDRDARRAVEAHLRLHPEARARLADLVRMLGPLAADAEDPEPPPGLADRTLAHIDRMQPRLRLPAAPPPSRRQVGGPAGAAAPRRSGRGRPAAGPHRRSGPVVAGAAVARLSGARLPEQPAAVLDGLAGVRRRPTRRRLPARGGRAAAQLRRRFRARPRRRWRPRSRRDRLLPGARAAAAGGLHARRSGRGRRDAGPTNSRS